MKFYQALMHPYEGLLRYGPSAWSNSSKKCEAVLRPEYRKNKEIEH